MRQIIFLIPLPEPLPLPHHTIYTFIGEHRDEMANVVVQPTAETPPAPDWAQGRLTTSLRVWQSLHEDEFAAEREMSTIVQRVAEAIAPGEAFEGFRRELEEWEEAERAAAPRDEESSPEALLDEGQKPPRSYVTIVEAVTPLVEVSDSDPPSAAYDRATDAVADLVRAFRIASLIPFAPVTRERLPFAIYYLTRNVSGRADWSHGLFLTHLNPPGGRSIDPVGPELVADFNRHLLMIQAGHPLVPLAERAVDARHALEVLGDTANSVIFQQLGIEVLIDASLELMLWDEAADVIAATEVLGLPLKTKVVRELPHRLGGNWNLTRGAVAEWWNTLYHVRNRVIHGGYVSTRDEGWRSLHAAEKFEDFLRTRVAEKATAIPRTALVILGVEGLQQRGKWHGGIINVAEQIGDTLLEELEVWRNAIDSARNSS